MTKKLKKIIAILCTASLLLGFYPARGFAVLPETDSYSALASTVQSDWGFYYPDAKISSYANYGTDTLVINIQDFHSDYDTQLIIANLLENINSNGSNIETYIEGAYEDVDLNYLKNLKIFPNFENFAYTLLKNDKITGSQYFTLKNGSEIVLHGLEDKELLLKNIENLAFLIENRNEILSVFEVYYENASKAVYSFLDKESKGFLKKKQDYEKGVLSEKNYMDLLAEYAKKHEIDCRNEYPNFEKAVKIGNLNKIINFKEVSKDLRAFTSFLKSRLPFKEYQMLDNSDKKIFMLGSFYKNYSFSTPALDAFFEFNELKESLNDTLIISEEEELFWNILTERCNGSLQKQMLSYFRVIHYAKKLMTGNILSYEYDALMARNGAFEDAFLKILNIDFPEETSRYYKLSKEYYDINEYRNIVFINKVGIKAAVQKESLPQKKDLKAALRNASSVKVLVTGGYHSRGICEILDTKKISYIVLTPNAASSSSESNASTLYENAILNQGKAVSAMQKLINLSPLIIRDDVLNMAALCNNVLLYEYIDFFEKQIPVQEKEKAYQVFFEGLTEKINESISSDENKIKNIKIKSVEIEKDSYKLEVLAEKADGKIIEHAYESVIDIQPESLGVFSRISGFFKDKFQRFFTKMDVYRSYDSRIMLKNIIQDGERLSIISDYCEKYGRAEDLSFLGRQIIDVSDNLIKNATAIIPLFKSLSTTEIDEIEKEIVSAVEMYFSITGSDYYFDSYAGQINDNAEKLKRLLNRNNIEFEVFSQDQSIEAKSYTEKDFYKELADNVDRYLKDPSSYSIPVFAHAAFKLRADKSVFNFNYEDRALSTLKEKYFKEIFLKQKPEAKRAQEALQEQAAEVLSYFKSKKFDVNDQEEIESALIRSIIAVQTLAEYTDSGSIDYLIKLSDEIFSLMHHKIGLKESEEKYLSVVNTDKEEIIAKTGKEYGDRAEYVRRITFFQDELIRNIANIGAKDISDSQQYREKALNFLIRIANGTSIEKNPGMEGTFWIKQNAVLRLKEYNSETAVKGLNEIIEAERSGEMHSPDSVFMAMNLEASNVKTISLELPASYVLIDFKRQDARELLKSDINKYFEKIQTIPAEDIFPYVVAANDILSDPEVSGEVKNGILSGFANINNEEIVFASMILIDLALERAHPLHGKSKTKGFNAAASFIKAFAGLSVFDGMEQIEGVRKEIAVVSSYDDLSSIVERIHNVLGNMSTRNSKDDDWLDAYKFYIISGGGVTGEVVKIEDVDMSDETLSLMSAGDDGGSSLQCRGENARRNGIMTIAPGDVVNFITSSAFLETSKAPLKNVIKDFMGYRFTETGSMAETVETLKKIMNLEKLAKDDGVEEEFEKFWKDIIFYSRLVDNAGFDIESNSLKNLIFEGMAIDNLAYGKGFMNPDGVYAAMKDFADLLGVKAMAATNTPYGNILKARYKGGIEVLGQSNISHKSTNLGRQFGPPRDFWLPETVGNVFDDINIKSKPVINLEKAKVIIAGMCSWLTSFGIQIADKDVANAIAANKSFDKILITNPVKDDENCMSLKESSFGFVERVTGKNFEELFNKIFVWGKPERERFSDTSHLTNTDVFEGKAGGYQGYNGMNGEDYEEIVNRGIRFKEIINGLGIRSVPRRDDRTKTNYKVAADTKVFSEYFWSFLSNSVKKSFTQKYVRFFSGEISETKFSNATALVFAGQDSGVKAKNSERASQGINTFTFIPISKEQAQERVLKGLIKSAEEYPGLLSPELETNLFFSVENMEGVFQSECYYIKDFLDLNEADTQETLAKWFIEEAPFLSSKGLIKYEDISLIESSEPAADFDRVMPGPAPLKVLVSQESSVLFDITLTAEDSYNTALFIEKSLEGFRKSIDENASQILHFNKTLDWSDINKDPQALKDFKDFLISIDAWDYPAKRAGMMLAVKRNYGMSVTDQGIHFINNDGKKLNFYIDANGKFQASEGFLRKMDELASLKIFADIDDNIAVREQPFTDEMKEVFSELILFGICPPVIISGNTKTTIGVRLDPLSVTVKEMIHYYSELGGVRYTWRESRTKEEYEESGEYGFFIDEDYVKNISKAAITKDINKELRGLVGNVDQRFDRLYVDYVKTTHNIEGFEYKAVKAVEKYIEGDAALELLKTVTDKKTKDELIQYWGTLKAEDVSAILAEIEKVYKSADKQQKLGIKDVLDEEKYMKTLELISLLEYARITYSDERADKKNKEVILNKEKIKEILDGKGEYPAGKADTLVRVGLTPVRITHVKDKIADFYTEKVTSIEKFKHLKVESSGRTTINIMNSDTQKTLPILHEMSENKTPPSKVMYSGDEVLKKGSSEATAGIDDSVAKLNEEMNGQMLVVNTNLEEHDTERRPDMVYARRVFDKNGLEAKHSVDVGTKMHSMFLERLEWNIDKIASEDDFEPENVIQAVKESVNSGHLDFRHYDFMKAFRNDDIRLIEIDRRMQYFRDAINWDKVNENQEILAGLKQFLQDINVWDDPAIRAGFLYALKNKFMTRITKKGFFFVDSNGKNLDFSIDPQGNFKSSRRYMSNMRKLASLRVFSDIDGSIVRPGEKFDNEMIEIFSNLTLYGLCAPSVISANSNTDIAALFDPLSEPVKDMITFYTDNGSQKYLWRTSENDAEYDEGGVLNFFPDNEYSQKVAKRERDIKKSLPIIIEMEKGISGEKVMFTADSVLLSGSAALDAGMDNLTASLNINNLGRDMFVVNTGLREHDMQAMPDVVFGKSAFDLSGESVSVSADIVKQMHKMILQRLEYNMGEIVKGKRKFKAENVVAVVKETVKAGFIEFFVFKGNLESVQNQIELMHEVRASKRMLSAA